MDGSVCMELAVRKNIVRLSTAYDTLARNKQAVRADYTLQYRQGYRSMYDELFQQFIVHL